MIPKVSAKRNDGVCGFGCVFFQYTLVLDWTQILSVVEAVLGSTQFTQLKLVYWTYNSNHKETLLIQGNLLMHLEDEVYYRLIPYEKE